MKAKGQQCSTTVILSLFRICQRKGTAKARGKMLKFAIEREHDKKRWNSSLE